MTNSEAKNKVFEWLEQNVGDLSKIMGITCLEWEALGFYEVVIYDTKNGYLIGGCGDYLDSWDDSLPHIKIPAVEIDTGKFLFNVQVASA